MIDRRAFLGTLAGSFLAGPLIAEAQQAGKVYRIGLLGGSPPTDPSGRPWEGFFQGLRELGYVEGQNVLLEGRWYGEQTDRLPALAAELVRLKVDVIVAGAAPAPEAAQQATSTIPVVFTAHPDPVGSGLVLSLARPGRNVTGLSSLIRELVGKQLQLLKEALLSNPTVPSNARLAQESGRRPVVL